MKEQIQQRFSESAKVILSAGQQLAERIGRAVDLVVSAYRAGGGVLAFGNGGSAADAQHIAGELVGRFARDRRPLRALALTTDPSVLTSVANDYGFEQIFARQVEAHGRAEDVAIGISTSGTSPNVVAGLAKARELGMKTIALTGPGGGGCAALADVLLDVPGTPTTPRIQEAHAVIYHILCERVEAALCNDD